MSFVASLFHFCDNDGPVVLLTTYNDKLILQGEEDVVKSKNISSDVIHTFITEAETCDVSSKDTMLNDEETHEEERIKLQVLTDKLNNMPETILSSLRSSCDLCRSFSPDNPFIMSSTDQNSEFSDFTFFSSRLPPDPILATQIRHACVRCLSCETNFGSAGTSSSHRQSVPQHQNGAQHQSGPQHQSVPQPQNGAQHQNGVQHKNGVQQQEDTTFQLDSLESPIIFSDNHCTAITQTFRLKDLEARGFKRTFGLSILSSDQQSLIQATPRLIQPSFARIVVELQKCARNKFHQDLARQEDGFKPADPSRDLTVITSCQDIFTWIHQKFSELLLQLLCVQFVELKSGYTTNDQDTANFETLEPDEYTLRRIIDELSDTIDFENFLFSFLSGQKSICFEALQLSYCQNISQCFTSLAPKPIVLQAKNIDNFWHCCNSEMCLPSTVLKHDGKSLILSCKSDSKDIFENSEIVREILKVVSNKRVPWEVVILQLEAQKTRWINWIKIWAAAKASTESIKREFLKNKALKSGDVKILDFWCRL